MEKHPAQQGGLSRPPRPVTTTAEEFRAASRTVARAALASRQPCRGAATKESASLLRDETGECRITELVDPRRRAERIVVAATLRNARLHSRLAWAFRSGQT